MPWFVPAPIVSTVSEPCTSYFSTRVVTGSAFALSQFGLFGSGFLMSGHFGNFDGPHALMRRSGGFGHGIVAWHCGSSLSGGVGQTFAHGGQPAGAPDFGQMFLQAGFFTSNANSSQGISASGTAASFGRSGMSSVSGLKMIPAICSLHSIASLYLPASPRFTAQTRMK